MNDILKIESQKSLISKDTGTVRISVQNEPNPHTFQFFFDYGTTPEGPWLKVCVNDTSFGIGYLPEEKK